MNKFIWKLRGFVRIKIKGADLARFLNLLAGRRVPFWDLEQTGDIAICFNIFLRDQGVVEELACSSLCEISKETHLGMKKYLKDIFSRPVLLMGIVLSVVLVLLAQKFLLFYEVVGNEKVSSVEIIRTLEEVGVDVGTYGANIDPKRIKNHMLGLMPQLQWLTVTQNGSVAQVVVRERSPTPQIATGKGCANIVASHDGMITEQFVYVGQAVKKPGDFVAKGELLVSGVVDLERIYTIVHAQAEIFAKTWRSKTTITPEICLNKTYSGEEHLCIWMEIGKQQIKILGNSGISTTACDKIVRRSNLALPGGYTLPVSLTVETYLPYTTIKYPTEHDDAQRKMQEYSHERIMEEMCAGEILSQEYAMCSRNGRYELEASYVCHEMIAKTVKGILKKEEFCND